jgi:hypothetical protein
MPDDGWRMANQQRAIGREFTRINANQIKDKRFEILNLKFEIQNLWPYSTVTDLARFLG